MALVQHIYVCMKRIKWRLKLIAGDDFGKRTPKPKMKLHRKRSRVIRLNLCRFKWAISGMKRRQKWHIGATMTCVRNSFHCTANDLLSTADGRTGGYGNIAAAINRCISISNCKYMIRTKTKINIHGRIIASRAFVVIFMSHSSQHAGYLCLYRSFASDRQCCVRINR